jgi:hypothetical protein
MPQTATLDFTVKAEHFLYQPPIVHLIATEIHNIPENEMNSANLKCIVTADNCKDYAIKEVANSTKGYIPASELFCYELARTMKINVPEYEIIEMQDGSYAFGSEWDGHAEYLDQFVDFLRIISGQDAIKNNDLFFSKVYALDIFVNNDDRHMGNFFVRKTYSGKIGVAYDFDKSWYEIGHDRFDAITCGSNTQESMHHVQDKRVLKKKIVKDTLDKIGELTSDSISSILRRMPTEWMSNEEKRKFLDWWVSDALAHRIAKLKKEGV